MKGRAEWTTAAMAGDGNKVPDRYNEKVPGLSMIVTATPKDVSDCISSWLAYLQMLNGLCSAGSRLAHCLGGLDASGTNHVAVAQCQAMWEELIKASTVASSNIKSQVLTTLQELIMTGDTDTEPHRLVDSGQVLTSSLVALINLQYQFSAACCECLGPLLGCLCPADTAQAQGGQQGGQGQRHDADCTAMVLQQCFQRLFPPPQSASSYRGARSPLQFTLAPFQVSQRRWSEAAAQEVGGGDGDGTMRRWSMPWESPKVRDRGGEGAAWPGGRLHPKAKLAVPGGGSHGSHGSQDRSRSTTPESVWHASMASQEELQEVIQLLSCPTPHSRGPSAKHLLPGVVLTGCGLEPGEPWSEGTTPGSRRGSSSPHRTSWAVPEALAHPWTDHDAHTPTGQEGNYELNPATLDPATLASRKSSSSTDSSSSYSLHSRSTTGSVSGASGGSGGSADGGPQEMRTHLYSMWTGSDVPFIKLPESNETLEEGEALRAAFYMPKSH